jgi:hypothetical protein
MIMAAGWAGSAQGVILRGLIVDSITQSPITNASISIKGLRGGARSNAEGRFAIPIPQREINIVVSSVGYNTETLQFDSVPEGEILFTLSRKAQQLKAAVVKNKSQKYRNKGNPAVELIRLVIDHKNQNRMESYQYATYQKYEKLVVSVDKVNDKITKNKILKPYHFLVENSDTDKLAGRRLSPVYLEETYSNNFYRKSPEKSKSIITGKRNVDYGELIDMKGVSMYLNRLYQDCRNRPHLLHVLHRRYGGSGQSEADPAIVPAAQSE